MWRARLRGSLLFCSFAGSWDCWRPQNRACSAAPKWIPFTNTGGSEPSSHRQAAKCVGLKGWGRLGVIAQCGGGEGLGHGPGAEPMPKLQETRPTLPGSRPYMFGNACNSLKARSVCFALPCRENENLDKLITPDTPKWTGFLSFFLGHVSMSLGSMGTTPPTQLCSSGSEKAAAVRAPRR